MAVLVLLLWYKIYRGIQPCTLPLFGHFVYSLQGVIVYTSSMQCTLPLSSHWFFGGSFVYSRSYQLQQEWCGIVPLMKQGAGVHCRHLCKSLLRNIYPATGSKFQLPLIELIFLCVCLCFLKISDDKTRKMAPYIPLM